MTRYFSQIDIAKPNFIGPGQWELRGLTDVVALFGKNGSGKSQLLRAWRNQDPAGVHYVVPERTGELGYNANYMLGQLNPNERKSNSERNFVVDYRTQIVGRIQGYFAARGDHRGGTPPANPEELESLVSQVLPDFTISISGTTNPPYKMRRVSDQSEVGNIDGLSSGEAQILTLALDILTISGIWEIQGNQKRVVLVDEPDAHVHPDLQVRFADFLLKTAKRFELQVVVSTHSTSLLAALGQLGREKASVLYLDRTRTQFHAEPFSGILQELSACLGGHALMGPLFGVPILLVEGDDDYRIWSQVPRHHVVSFAVIPGGGDEIKKYQRALERVFAALREPDAPLSGYALIDRDKGKPQADASTPQNHIRYIQLACHESENLYLTDEVLAALELTWDQAKAKIVAAAPKFGEKEVLLATAATWERKAADIKDVIEEVASILDAKRVHWTIRVARTIGVARPSGQLLDFLSDEVVDALWGKLPAPVELVEAPAIAQAAAPSTA